ncbi:hypothetical protein NLX78_22800 [Paenibacillus sp. Lou8.1]|uniref:hypothetical protein n=1 Tax=Paenibacillus sp. Lou8.1 TaxID=2962041 RepID=UPI0020B786CF|nr:hypothetical protein [Paenibacillus sp. Lou8.1]MCP3810053.1 hypothetical protein [Paenibacillus sp. Lou8.1]
MIQWIKYDPKDRSIESHVDYLVTCGMTLQIAQHAHLGSGEYGWLIQYNHQINVTHYSEINMPEAIETNEQPSEAAAE